MPGRKRRRRGEDDWDVLFEAGLDLGDWQREYERWSAWRDEVAGARSVWVNPFARRVPDWHRPEAVGRVAFGWYSDHEWALTVRVDSRYL